MFSHWHLNNKITIHMTFSLKPQLSSIINSLWYLKLLITLNNLNSFSWTLSTRLTDCLSTSITTLALSSHHHYPLMECHVSTSFTCSTFLRFCSWLRPTSFTYTACTSSFYLNCLYYTISTFVAPFTDSLKSISHKRAISSDRSSLFACLLRPLLPPPPPKLDPNRS